MVLPGWSNLHVSFLKILISPSLRNLAPAARAVEQVGARDEHAHRAAARAGGHGRRVPTTKALAA